MKKAMLSALSVLSLAMTVPSFAYDSASQPPAVVDSDNAASSDNAGGQGNGASRQAQRQLSADWVPIVKCTNEISTTIGFDTHPTPPENVVEFSIQRNKTVSEVIRVVIERKGLSPQVVQNVSLGFNDSRTLSQFFVEPNPEEFLMQIMGYKTGFRLEFKFARYREESSGGQIEIRNMFCKELENPNVTYL